MTCPDPKQRRSEGTPKELVSKGEIPHVRYRLPDWVTFSGALGFAAVVLLYVGVTLNFSPLTATEGGATDTKHDKGGTSSVGRKPHAKPPKHAKTPPCAPKAEREVNGACYLIMKMAPPCHPEHYEDGGECLALQYVAPNTSVEE
jgi:hypothetical protein